MSKLVLGEFNEAAKVIIIIVKIVIAGKERLKLKNNMNIIAQKMPVLPEILGTCEENLPSYHTSLLKVK